MASAESRALPVVGLLGAGRMGRGIAVAYAFGGVEAVLVDVKARTEADLRRLTGQVRAEVTGHLDALVRLGTLPADAREEVAARITLVPRAEAPAALPRVDVLFEGVPETLDAKREAFAFAGAHLRADTVVASTTSTILATQLAELVPGPERFLNAHWLNPAFLVPIVEISPHERTDPAAVDRLDEVLRLIGKRPVRMAPRAGYIVPRLQSLILNEAARMVEEGIATAEEIDEAVRLGFGFRYATIGALEFIDFGGLDILYHANRYLTGELGDRYRLAPIVEEYMAQGRTGLSAGAGFYDWTGDAGERRRAAVLARQYDLLRLLEAAPTHDQARDGLARDDQDRRSTPSPPTTNGARA